VYLDTANSASINLKADHAASYMYLGLTLSRLDDIDNACSAYDKALELQPQCTLTLLNYATSLLTHAADHSDAARVSTLLAAAEAQLQQQQSDSSKSDNTAQLVTHCEQLRAALTAHSASVSVTTK
jgi:Flp pilus assembly protein TadD